MAAMQLWHGFYTKWEVTTHHCHPACSWGWGDFMLRARAAMRRAHPHWGEVKLRGASWACGVGNVGRDWGVGCGGSLRILKQEARQCLALKDCSVLVVNRTESLLLCVHFASVSCDGAHISSLCSVITGQNVPIVHGSLQCLLHFCRSLFWTSIHMELARKIVPGITCIFLLSSETYSLMDPQISRPLLRQGWSALLEQQLTTGLHPDYS